MLNISGLLQILATTVGVTAARGALDSLLHTGSIKPPKTARTHQRALRLPHQGHGEMARRRRQIAAGHLTESNGLLFAYNPAVRAD